MDPLFCIAEMYSISFRNRINEGNLDRQVDVLKDIEEAKKSASYEILRKMNIVQNLTRHLQFDKSQFLFLHKLVTKKPVLDYKLAKM